MSVATTAFPATQAKSDAASCVQPLIQQYYNCCSAMSGITFTSRYPANSWSNCTFFPVVADDAPDKGVAVMVYFSTSPIYIKEAGYAATNPLHYKGRWTGSHQDYELCLPIDMTTGIYTNSSIYGIDPDAVRKVLHQQFTYPKSRGKSYFLTFIAQDDTVHAIHDNSWELAVLACASGAPTAMYTGATSVAGFMLAHVNTKAKVAKSVGLRLIVMRSQIASANGIGSNYVETDFPDAVYMAADDSKTFVCLSFFTMLSMLSAVLFKFREEVAVQSGAITGQIAASKEKYHNPAKVKEFIGSIVDEAYDGTGSEILTKVTDLGSLLSEANSAIAKAKADDVNEDTIANAQALVAKITTAAAGDLIFTKGTQIGALLGFINMTNGWKGKMGAPIERNRQYTPSNIRTENDTLQAYLGKPVVPNAVKGKNPEAAKRAREENEKAKVSAMDLVRQSMKKQ